MEVTGLSGVGIGGEAQLLITGAAGEQPLIMSAEDAAQLLAQAGLQLADLGDSERIIIEGARHPGHQGHGGHQDGEVSESDTSDPSGTGPQLVGYTSLRRIGFQVGLIDANGEPLLSGSAIDVTGDGGDINDGAVLYIDPTDPQVSLGRERCPATSRTRLIDAHFLQASALLQQVGLTLAEDGTVHSIEDAPVKLEGYENGGNGELGSELFLQSDIHQAGDQVKEEMDHLEQDPEELPQDYVSGCASATLNFPSRLTAVRSFSDGRPDAPREPGPGRRGAGADSPGAPAAGPARLEGADDHGPGVFHPSRTRPAAGNAHAMLSTTKRADV